MNVAKKCFIYGIVLLCGLGTIRALNNLGFFRKELTAEQLVTVSEGIDRYIGCLDEIEHLLGKLIAGPAEENLQSQLLKQIEDLRVKTARLLTQPALVDRTTYRSNEIDPKQLEVVRLIARFVEENPDSDFAPVLAEAWESFAGEYRKASPGSR